jgi:23S rRNA U2552 (ribose-2'-O)-methylase RlmE/FtsJ
MPAKKSASKKQPLQLDAPPASDSEDEQVLEIAISPVVTAQVEVKLSSVESAAVSAENDPIELVSLVSSIQNDIKADIREVGKEIAALMEIVGQKKQLIKEKTSRLKLWEKRVSTPTTAENASLAVKVKENDRQLHNDDDGSLWYKSGLKKQYIKVSAVKVSTKSVRDAGKLVLDGKEAKVHIKDPTVTLSDLEAVEETELVEKFTAMSSSNI